MQEYIENLIKNFIDKSKKSSKFKYNWSEPIVGFADAKNPLFLQLKRIINENHKIPTELLIQAKTVISYFIPFNKKVVSSNSNGKHASKEWAIAYIETNKLITDLNTFLADILKKENYDSIQISPTHNFDKDSLVSFWSHKHIAYIAGLGNFGLHKMLITEKGCCGRLGSIITSVSIEPTITKQKEYCLYFHNKSCKNCIDNCFYNILTLDSFNRHKCYYVCLENGQIYSHLGLSDMCGKCACGVPCSLKNPVT